jgi:hypothetical protein
MTAWLLHALELLDRLTIGSNTATVTSDPGSQAPVTVRCNGRQLAFGSGQSLQFTL